MREDSGRPDYLEPDHLEDLATRAAEGDHGAFGSLADALRPALLRWALVQTGDPDDAEDVVQRSLLHMYRGLPSFQFRSRIRTWAYSVVRRAAADSRRESRRRQARDHRYLSELEAVTAGPDGTEAGPLAALVRRRLAGLSGRQREVFDLVDLQSHTAAEVAELLGMSPNTVRTHLLRARRALRAAVLEEEPHLVEDR